MVNIDKSSAEAQVSIDILDAFLTANRVEIDRAMASNTRNGRSVFKILENPTKRELTLAILNEQGGLCCYCGSKIESSSSNRHLEHLIPVKDSKALALDHSNLFVSCQGQQDAVYRVFSRGEQVSLEQLARDFGVSVDRIKTLNAADLEEHWEFLEEEDEETVIQAKSEGAQILLIEKKGIAERHCGHKKDNARIEVHPLTPNCLDFFKFNSSGEIFGTTTQARDSISTLGLNVELLKNNRQGYISKAFERLRQVLKLAPPVRQTMLGQMIQKLQTRQADTQAYEPYFFVSVAILNNQIQL